MPVNHLNVKLSQGAMFESAVFREVRYYKYTHGAISKPLKAIHAHATQCGQVMIHHLVGEVMTAPVCSVRVIYLA